VFFLHTLCVFRSPYFKHNAFMHHTMHVLQTPLLDGALDFYRLSAKTSIECMDRPIPCWCTINAPN